MSTIEKFEDLRIWQESRELVKSVYTLTKEKEFAKDYGMKDQIQRAALSVMSNIAEGFERGSKKEFIQFLYLAKGSCAETRSLAHAAADQCYMPKEAFSRLYEATVTISKGISKLLDYLKTTDRTGSKFRSARPVPSPQAINLKL